MKNRKKKRVRRRAEKAPKRSGHLFDPIPVGYVALDRRGMIQEINQTASSLLERPRSSLMGKPFITYVKDGGAQKFLDYLRQCQNANGKVTTELDIGIKGGRSVHVQLQSLPLRVKGSKDFLCQTVMIETMDRKYIEEALIESERKFREIFDEAPVGYHELDPEGRIVRVNRTELAILGYTAEEMLGQPVWKFVVEEKTSHQAVLEKIAGVDSSIQPFERTYRRKDGRAVPVLIQDRILRERGGKVIGIRSTLQNITNLKQAEEKIRRLTEDLEQRVVERTAKLETANRELQNEIAVRRQTEKELEEQRKLLETILRQAADAIVVCDENRRMTFVNATARSMAQLDPTGTTLDMASKVWGQAFDYDGRYIPVEEGPLSRALKGERIISKRTRMVHQNGNYYDVLISASPLKGSDQRIIGAVAIFSDMTKRTQAEEEIKKLNEDLKRRTLELVVANKELEAFAYTVAHDLKNPLIIMEGFVRKLLGQYEKKFDNKGIKYLQQMREASQQMSQLVEDLLNLSQVTRGRIKFEKVDLSALTRAIVQDLRKTNPQRIVRFIVTENVMGKGDPQLLRIALHNLLSNAWKFTSKTEKAIIEFGTVQGGDERAYFIRDNGCGFDMAQVERIFKPFGRLHPSNEYPGTGIGLATVYRIIRRHHGRIWAESAVAQGTTFFFTL
jgi:PAS domain S-box-containing protein